MSKPLVLVSTGAFVGRANGFDEKAIARLHPAFDCDGFEFMVIEPWYGRYDEVAKNLLASGFVPKTVHLEKKIGILLAENTPESIKEACLHYEENIKLAARMGAELAVLHLWGGLYSDFHISGAVSVLPDFYASAEKNGILLTVENIPCKNATPLAVWKELDAAFPDVRFIFDTRFGSFHRETDEIIKSPLWQKVCHMHISDYGGDKLQWETLRPILHPGEGGIDFPALFARIPAFPPAVAVESPVLGETGEVSVEKMNRTVEYVRRALP